jgi:thiosulfate/3-mercaptopyruvate sulfurtransferase
MRPLLPQRHLAATLACALLSIHIPRTMTAQKAAFVATPPTVSTAWLAEHLRDPNLVLLHVGDRKGYDKEHIPGARFIDLDDISVSNMDHDHGGLMLEMPQPDSLRAHLQALGISDNSRVIVYYGTEWVSPATRVVFTLDYAGLGAGSALLDGGMQAWKTEHRSVTAEMPKPQRGTLSALKIKPIVVNAAWVNSRIGTPNFHLIDGRAAVYYDGVEAGGPRKGHIKSARSLPFTEVVDDRMYLRKPAELKALFAKAGVADGDTVVAYCHVGQQGTAVLFAARAIGHPVLLYDGSFEEWSRHPELPVEDPRAGKPSAQ